MRPLETKEDIDFLVDQFYSKVKIDPLIGPIFNEVAKVHWESHLPKISHFWEDLLLGTHHYFGRPFPPHFKLNLKTEHFERWLGLFIETVNEHFVGLKAEEIKNRALRIGQNFMFNLGLLSK